VRRSALLLLALALTACSDKSPASAGSVAVTATDTACTLGKTDLAAGKTTFAVKNDGKDVTEVYVYGENDKVLAEKENIGPGLSASFTADLPAGMYEVACKPGQKGDGIRTAIHVTGSGGATAKTADREVAFRSKDYTWTGLETFTAKPGETIRFEMVNDGPAEHEFEVLDADGKALGEIGPTAKGEDGEVVLTFEKAGSYAYKCGIADHEDRGMVGTFQVS
jgi:iron uptake system component EfeO